MLNLIAKQSILIGNVCQCYLIWQIDSLEKHSCQLSADITWQIAWQIKLDLIISAKDSAKDLCEIWDVFADKVVSTWTSCMSSCLSSSIILTWKEVMVVQQPIFKYSNTDNIEPQPRTGSHSPLTGSHSARTLRGWSDGGVAGVVTDVTDGDWLLLTSLYLLTGSWALTAWWATPYTGTNHHHHHHHRLQVSWETPGRISLS